MAGAFYHTSKRKRLAIGVAIYWAAFWFARAVVAVEVIHEHPGGFVEPVDTYQVALHDALKVGVRGPTIVALLALAWWVYRGFKPAVANVAMLEAPKR